MSILVLHGALGSRHQFEPLLAALGPTASFLEFHGHGSTPDVDAAWSIELFAAQLEATLVEMDRPQIFGYSMGGYVAMYAALRRPELFSSIITLATKLEWSPSGSAHEIKKLNADVIQEKVPAFAADLQRRHGADRWRVVLGRTATLMTDLGSHPLITADVAANLTVPVHLGVGDRDEMVSIEETIHIYRSTPLATLTVFPSMRHPIERASVEQLVHHITRMQ